MPETLATQIQEGLPPLAVSMQDVHFHWPGQAEDILSIPSFSVHRGEHIFIAGPSGSGKSTLLSLVAGIILPTKGTIVINGRSMSSIGKAERDLFRGDHIGFIFQQFNLIPYLSVVENVLLPVRLSEIRQKRCEDACGSPEEQAHRLLLDLELSCALWDKPVHALSVGQQQRVAAARALLGHPELLIADEPTSSLDEDRRGLFLQLLLAQCNKAGSTLLFVSHDKTLAGAFSRVVFLNDINQAQTAPLNGTTSPERGTK
ncbi:MAG: ABC transporter ATP-binding protein [Desulfovibrio sp.]|nr:ABC transporter ATP-binding protein [Desulfovibrio sp.]